MREKKNKKKGKGLAVVLGIIWGIMLVVLAFSVKNIFSFREDYYYSNPEYIFNYIVSEEYGSIYNRIQNMIETGIKGGNHPEYDELIAIHDYMEAGAQYKMYSAGNDMNKAAKYKAEMEKAKAALGKLAFTAAEMDKALGLTD